MRKPWYKRVAVGAAVAAVWLTVWQLLATRVDLELLLPSPLVVGQTLVRLAGTAEFWKGAATSLLRVLCGFAAAVVCGCLLAAATARFAALRALVSPILAIVKSVPVASFILLAFVWIGSEVLPAVIAFSMVLPIVWSNAEKGLKQTDIKLLELAKVSRFGAVRTWRHIRIPAVMPYLLPALTTGLGFAWKSGIAAEIIAFTEFSIGYYMYRAKSMLETAELFAWTVLVVVLSLVMEWVLAALLRQAGKHMKGVS